VNAGKLIEHGCRLYFPAMHAQKPAKFAGKKEKKLLSVFFLVFPCGFFSPGQIDTFAYGELVYRYSSNFLFRIPIMLP
jgi:hypothetical protein